MRGPILPPDAGRSLAKSLSCAFFDWADGQDWLWIWAARKVAPYLPPRPPSPNSFTLTFLQERNAVPKAFIPIATIDPPPANQGIAEQVVVYSVDGGEQQETMIPVTDASQEFEFPVSLRVGERLSGGFGYVDDSPNKNRSDLFAFDITVTDDLDTTAPDTPTGFSLGFRQVWIPDAGEPTPTPTTGETPPTEDTPPTGDVSPVVDEVPPVGDVSPAEETVPGTEPTPTPGTETTLPPGRAGRQR